MLVIVEGIDRSGKSTLCKALSMTTRKYSIFKDKCEISSSQSVLQEKVLTTLSLLEQIHEHDNIIVDRLFLTELVYGIVDRGYFDKEFYDILVRRLDALRHKIVLVLVKNDSVDLASSAHGSDLSLHQSLFEFFFNIVPIERKTTILTSEIFSMEAPVFAEVFCRQLENMEVTRA